MFGEVDVVPSHAVDGENGTRWCASGPQKGAWWQVDLGRPQRIARIVVFNRCDAASRAARLLISLSDDGRQFRPVYRHDGPAFFGISDGRPLQVSLAGQSARYVRLLGIKRGTEWGYSLFEFKVYGRRG